MKKLYRIVYKNKQTGKESSYEADFLSSVQARGYFNKFLARNIYKIKSVKRIY